MRLSMKNIAVSGSLTPDEWNDSLVCGVMELGLPIFFLPHVIKETLIVRYLWLICGRGNREARRPVMPLQRRIIPCNMRIEEALRCADCPNCHA